MVDGRVSRMDIKVDFVIPWVDGSDPEWQKEKAKYDNQANIDKRDIRYRDLENLKYWFRGVEKFTPWVNKVHFITWGHIPKWLNTNHPKLNIVYHEDYIPKKYLPTFSSRVIELNIHRIKGLSEYFVYFNDDMFILDNLKKEYFFKNKQPRDTGIIRPNFSSFRNSTANAISNVMEIINTNYSKKEVLTGNLLKWFHPVYKLQMLNTIFMLPYKLFPGFLNQHLPNSYLKSTFETTWDIEFEALDRTCKNKFRTGNDVNQILFKYIQLVEGNFYPRGTAQGKFYNFTNDNRELINDIVTQKYKVICINDNGKEHVIDFDKKKEELDKAFKFIFPERSYYEK